jgi:ribosomal protein S18 acetylase RimI-like enzyme
VLAVDGRLLFSDNLPDPAQFKRLYDLTGWRPEPLATSQVAATLSGSWRVMAVYDGDELVGFGRVISDGVLHAFVTEAIVAPSHRGSGLGSQIVARLVAACRSAGLTDIQLFAAAGRRGFYERLGFVSRPHDAPGMQWDTGASLETAAGDASAVIAAMP